MKVLLQKIREILRNRKIRNRFTRVISVFTAVVVFTTTYALVLPAITMEKQAGCGIEAHQHDDSCYTDVLVCGLEESEEHHHDESCYDRILVCGKEVHVHSDTCYHKDEGNGAVAAMAEEADDPDATVHTDAEYASAADDSEEGIAKEENTGGGNSTEDHSGDNSDGNDQTDESETGNGENVQAGSTASADAAVPAEYSEDAGSQPGQNGKGVGEVPANANIAGTASEMTEEGYAPASEPLSFGRVLNSKTGIYYHHVKEDEEIEEPSEITDWEKADQDTELGKNDLLRVYLSYTIPGGLLNTTSETARYRLPSNLHLTDEQVKAINETENGIAAQFISHKTLEISDPDNYYKYLGAEAVEGIRKPSDDKESYLAKYGGQENISATVRVENVDGEGNDGRPAQNLIFTFVPYSLQKNRHEYDAAGQPTKAGEKIYGWITLDISTDQIDWSDPEVPASETSDNTVSDNNIISDNKARAEGTESRENGNTGAEGIDNKERNEASESEEKAAAAPRKIEPAAPVSVNIQLFDTEVSGNVEQYDAEQYKVIHFADEGTEEIQDVTAQTIESEQVQDSTSGSKATEGSSEAVPPTEVQFQAESFSIYGVVYTVDFYWKVDGKEYRFSFPGGGYVSFTDLVEVLGIAGGCCILMMTSAKSRSMSGRPFLCAHTRNGSGRKVIQTFSLPIGISAAKITIFGIKSMQAMITAHMRPNGTMAGAETIPLHSIGLLM